MAADLWPPCELRRWPMIALRLGRDLRIVAVYSWGDPEAGRFVTRTTHSVKRAGRGRDAVMIS